jgi:Flp pilus assembly protein TadG
MKLSTIRRQPGKNRRGATLVETAVVLPVFFTFLFGFIEFGHCFMTIHTLNSAARRAARMGVGENVSSEDVHGLAHSILDSAIDADLEGVNITVKDASIFDEPTVAASEIDFSALPTIELANVESRELFMVRIEVPYHEIGIMGPRWVDTLNLYGQSVMRKE